MNGCLFCKIIAGEIPSTKVFENDAVFAFRDINPQAPIHVLVVPKTHIACADDINAENAGCVSECFQAIVKIAAAEGLKDDYRIINNCGEAAGQTVQHLHFHLIGGRELSEKIV